MDTSPPRIFHFISDAYWLMGLTYTAASCYMPMYVPIAPRPLVQRSITPPPVVSVVPCSTLKATGVLQQETRSRPRTESLGDHIFLKLAAMSKLWSFSSHFMLYLSRGFFFTMYAPPLSTFFAAKGSTALFWHACLAFAGPCTFFRTGQNL